MGQTTWFPEVRQLLIRHHLLPWLYLWVTHTTAFNPRAPARRISVQRCVKLSVTVGDFLNTLTAPSETYLLLLFLRLSLLFQTFLWSLFTFFYSPAFFFHSISSLLPFQAFRVLLQLFTQVENQAREALGACLSRASRLDAPPSCCRGGELHSNPGPLEPSNSSFLKVRQVSPGLHLLP